MWDVIKIYSELTTVKDIPPLIPSKYSPLLQKHVPLCSYIFWSRFRSASYHCGNKNHSECYCRVSSTERQHCENTTGCPHQPYSLDLVPCNSGPSGPQSSHDHVTEDTHERRFPELLQKVAWMMGQMGSEWGGVLRGIHVNVFYCN